MTADAKSRLPAIFGPLRHRAFAFLWVGMMISSVGFWAQSVGAQWLFINDPNAATIVALVSSATSLPSMLFALPAGVLSDAFDRRTLMIWLQTYFVVIGTLLAILTFLNLMPPILLLAFTFAIGMGLAANLPTWQPLITELVPRSEISNATQLDMVNVNVARAVGPAIAGAIIARWGVPQVFMLNAVCVAVPLVALLLWRRPAAVLPTRERFMPALRAGGRYVRHEPTVRVLLIRSSIFVVGANALWALLPLIANRQLGLAADGFGVMLAALGIGAVLGALTLTYVRRILSANVVLIVSALAYAGSLSALVLTSSILVAMPFLVLGGYCWTATLATINSALQLHLPDWVRARGLALYIMTFMGVQAVAAPVWGLLTQYLGLRTAVLTAAAVLVVGAVIGIWLKVPDSHALDRSAISYWGEAQLAVAPHPSIGPVQVVVEYQIPPADLEGWLVAMNDLRRSRRRTGAFRWELYEIGERPGTYWEVFTVATWDEHARQHEGRLTAQDQAIEERALAFSTVPPSPLHLLPPASDDS